MAQQLGMMRVRGKLGNVVGFSNSASEKTNNNFYRERATTISNPKTEKQATQRSKVKPAAAFYSAFESILNHAFLPSQRPVKNRNKFMKKAMTLDAVPDVRKDDNYLPVLPYQVSEGNLGLDYLTIPSLIQDNGLEFGFSGGYDDTVAAFTLQCLSIFPELEEGEELTFMAVVCKAGSPYVRQARHFSIVLDSNNTVTTLGDIMSPTGLALTDGSFTTYSDAYTMLGGAVIISSKTSSSWRYTKSFFYLTNYAENLPDITSEVILSYMSADAQKTSDLILQQADNDASDGTVQGNSLTTVPLSNDSEHAGTLSPTTATVLVYNTGTRKVVVDTIDGEAVMVYKNASNQWVPITRTSEVSGTSVTANVPLSTTNLAGSPTIFLVDLQRLYPELAY